MIDPVSPSRPICWWETRRFALAMMLLAIVPLLLPPIPPITDLMGHMGRYRVQLDLATSPWLKDYYSFHWAIIGNLGCDLLVQLLGPILGLELAVKLVVMAIPAITVAGILLVAREVHGRVPATALFALPLAYAYPFQFGFINFALAMGLMLILFALWLRMARTGHLKQRPYLFFILSFLLWLAHSFAWGVLGILCFMAEGVRWRSAGKGWFESGWRAVVGCLPLAPPALLLLPWRRGEAPQGTFDWFDWHFKWTWLYSVLRERVELWDEAGGALLYGVALSGLVWKPWRRYESMLGIGAVLLIITFVCLPRVLLGSSYADMRLVPYMLAVAILALRPIADRRLAHAIAAFALAFFMARITVTTLAFLKYERNYRHQLVALDHIPMGSRVLALATVPCRTAWYTNRMEHLSSMATVRRQAFVNDQWEAPGAQLLRVTYRPAGRWFSHDPSQILRRPDCRARNEPVLSLTLKYFPRAAFDYVWMIDMPRDRWPSDPDLVPIWNGPLYGILYRVIHNPSLPEPLGSATARSETPKGGDQRPIQ